MRTITGVVFGAILAGARLGAGQEAPRIAYPPKTEVTYQALVARAPEVGSTAGIWHRSIDRGYDAVAFAVDPGDPAKGSRWLSYDTGQCKVVTLIEDLSSFVVQKAAPGLLGHRVTALHEVAKAYGTGAPTAEGTFAGGRVIRNGRDLGAVSEGWSVAAFEPDWLGTVKSRGEVLDKAILALARSPDGKTYRLYAASETKLAPLGIEGGEELRAIHVEGGYVYCRRGDAVVRIALTSDAAPEPVTEKSDALLLVTDPKWRRIGGVGPRLRFLMNDAGQVAAVERDAEGKWQRAFSDAERRPATTLPPATAPHQVGTWGGARSWTERLGRDGSQDIIKEGGLGAGFLVFASDAKPGEAARLGCWIPALGSTSDLGLLAPFEGQPLHRVYRVRVLPFGDVAVLAGNEQTTVIQIYQNPVLDTICAQAAAAIERRAKQAGGPVLTLRCAKSLYEFAEHADRTFGSLAAASDGRVYFGVMPHNPVKSSPIFRYDPRTDEVKLLGDFGTLAGSTGPGLIASMMHAPPVEMDGKLYFTGQDPFYGEHTFPGMTPENTRYAGSPILEYDLKTERFTPLGIPLPKDYPGLAKVTGGASVFHVVANPKTRELYLRPGYSSGEWWTVKIGTDGKFAGPPMKMPFPRQPTGLHVAEDGMVYYPLVQMERSPNDSTAGPPCDIWRFNPETRTAERAASFDVVQLNGGDLPGRARLSNACSWMEGQSPGGQVLGVAASGAMYIRFDPKTGTVTKVGLDLRRGSGASGVHGEKAYYLSGDAGEGAFGMVSASVLDLATGKFTALGKVRDDRGRWLSQVTTVHFTAEGKMLLSGEVWGAPGDRYARRYRTASSPERRDSCLWVIDNPEALRAQ